MLSYESLADIFEYNRWINASQDATKYTPSLISYDEFIKFNEDRKQRLRGGNGFASSGEATVEEIVQGTSFTTDIIKLGNGRKGTMLELLNAINDGLLYITNPSKLKDWYGFNYHSFSFNPPQNYNQICKYAFSMCDKENENGTFLANNFIVGAEDIVRHGGGICGFFSGHSTIVLLKDLYYGTTTEKYTQSNVEKRFTIIGKIESLEQLDKLLKEKADKYDVHKQYNEAILERDQAEETRRQQARSDNHKKYGSPENYKACVEWARNKESYGGGHIGDHDLPEILVLVNSNEDLVYVYDESTDTKYPVYSIDEGERIFDDCVRNYATYG